jgi:hypothetical protein
MRGNPPLVLFTTLARDRRLFFKFFNSGLLDRGHLTIRQREIVIDRVTATAQSTMRYGQSSPETIRTKRCWNCSCSRAATGPSAIW